MTATPDADADTADAALDPATFATAPVLVENWLSGAGRRLYELSGRHSNLDPLYAYTAYERHIDEDTGEPAEDETTLATGTLAPHLHLNVSSGRLYERICADQGEDLADHLTEGDVELLLHDFESLFPKRVRQLIHEEGCPVVDIHLNSDLRIPVDMDEEEYWFSEQGSGMDTVYWGWFFAALVEEATCLDSVYGNDEFATAYAYAFDARQSFEPVADWRLRAAENHHCGTYGSSPALATVAALLDAETDHSQSEIATILGRDESTISRQVTAVEEHYERSRWMCENRL